MRLKKSTAKCALKSKCLNSLVYEKIKEDVRVMSLHAVETSLYIHHCLYKQWKNNVFHDKSIRENTSYFYALWKGSLKKYAPHQKKIFYDKSYK